MASDLRAGLLEAGRLLGVDPTDLGTVVSYETGGTFDPWQKGPTTKWGTHRGLIQFGEPQAKEFGAFEGQSAYDQLTGPVVGYLKKAGVQPGMGLLDIYSAVNAGRVGRYDASDAAAGGAPGTVRDKVETQMGGHRAKAAALLGGEYTPPTPRSAGAAAGSAPSSSPFGFAGPAPSASAEPTAADDSADLGRLIAQLTSGAIPSEPEPAAAPPPRLSAAPPPPQFDAARFFALLPRRA